MQIMYKFKKTIVINYWNVDLSLSSDALFLTRNLENYAFKPFNM